MEYFNFLGLPDVVQDLIVHEIVHNSVPNDRIQLARTCKYMNEAVKRAKPKKIVEKVTIDLSDDLLLMHFDSKSVDGKPSPTLVTKVCDILQQIQIEELEVVFLNSLSVEENDLQYPKFLHDLFEASKFINYLCIMCRFWSNKMIDFYGKLHHLESLSFFGSSTMFISFPYYPSKMKLTCQTGYDSGVLESITKKTGNNPLSSLFLDNCIPLEDLQKFLQKTKFKNGCEIYCKVQNPEGKEIHMFVTFIDDEQGFEIETFPEESSLIVADQKYDGKQKRILTLSVIELSTHFEPLNDAEPWRVPFNVTTKSQPTEPVFSGHLVDGEQNFVLENIKENDWIKINIISQDIAYVRYSNKMLESNFPRNDFASAQERLTFINATLGCQIIVIKVEELIGTIQKLKKGRIPLPDLLRGNTRKRRPPSFFEDES